MRQWMLTFMVALALAGAGAGCSADAGADSGSRSGCAAGADGSLARFAIASVLERAASVEPIDLGAVEAPEPYAYSQLDAPDQERYRILLDVFRSREARSYPDDDMDRLTRVRDCVLADHPELFSVESVHMETATNALTGEVASVSVEGRYADSADGAAEVLRAAELAADECFAGLPAGADDYAKAKRTYEFLAGRVEYDQGGASSAPSPDQTIEGALANGLAVCGGYANACAYLLQSAGVQCATITGMADGAEHAWCLARLDGAYYYIDPTWGDPIGGSLNYDYLAITSADLELEHAATSPFPLPRCSAVADNFYVREDLMFDWPDEARFAALVTAGLEQVRCSDGDTYAALLDFVTSGRLASRLAVEQYRYSCSDKLLTLKVYLP